jgi:hypothetical protein
MTAMRSLLAKIWYRFPLPPKVRVRLGGLIRRLLGRAEAIGDFSITVGAQNREWVHTIMVSNLKGKIAELKRRLAEAGSVADMQSHRRRTRDVDDYVKLGGRMPPS